MVNKSVVQPDRPAGTDEPSEMKLIKEREAVEPEPPANPAESVQVSRSPCSQPFHFLRLGYQTHIRLSEIRTWLRSRWFDGETRPRTSESASVQRRRGVRVVHNVHGAWQ